MELADALPRQTAVIKLQDVPDIHRHRADLLDPHAVLCLHWPVTAAHIHSFQNGANR